MINYEELISLKESGKIDPEHPQLIQAMLYDAAGDWDKAHSIAQDQLTNDGSWVHAYLHRKEGDTWNANYWYNRADKKMPDISLDEEWDSIARSLVSR